MAYRHIDVTPVTGALGALIEGVDLAKPVAKPVFAEIKKAWLDHQVVFFRDQDLSPDAQIRFARRFGGIHTHPFMKTMPGHPEILEIVKLESDKRNFGNHWHTDQIFMPKPAKATMLYATEVPDAGGDTLFANLYAAYDTLSPG